MDDNTLTRRADDRDREFTKRLDRVDEANRTLTTDITSLGTKIAVMTVEQEKLSELFDVRFKILEKDQTIVLAKVEGVSKDIASLRHDIVTMASDTENSPAGKALMFRIDNVVTDVESHRSQLTAMNDWQKQIEGVLNVVKFIGLSGLASGLGALLWVALRAFQVAP